jgi:hypothetical protein
MKSFIYIYVVILLILSIFGTWLVMSNNLIPYADDEEKISIKEDSIRQRNSSFFYASGRSRGPGGGGFFDGK